MNAVLATQPGPLTWVKPEIDFALERARVSIDKYFGAPERNGAELATALGAVREVTGALQIIGMEAPGRVSKELEQLLAAIAERAATPVPRLRELALRATTSLGQYLSDLIAGEPDNAMNLLPVLGELSRARGAEAVDERDLFYPDLTICPPPHPNGRIMDSEAVNALVRLQRARLQRGMLNWLRQSDDGLELMRDALQEIERAQPQPQDRAPWWIAAALIEGLLYGGLASNDELKRLAGKIDRHLAGFGGARRPAEALLREMLYHLARCEPVSPLVRDVKALFRLDRFMLPAAVTGLVAIDADRVRPLLRNAQNTLASADQTELSRPETRREEERKLVGQVAREITANLQQVEETLDSFFRSNATAESLSRLPPLLQTVVGALRILALESPAALIEHCMRVVDALACAGAIPPEEQVILLADGLSSVALYVQSMAHGAVEEQRAVETVLARFEAARALGESSVPDLPMDADSGSDDKPDIDFEVVAEQETLGVDSLAVESADSPRGEYDVTDKEIDALLDCVDLGALEEHAGMSDPSYSVQAPFVASSGGRTTATSTLAESPRPVETQLAQETSIAEKDDRLAIDARTSGVDPEIVSVFLEEATEILTVMGELADRVRVDYRDRETLQTIRRGFHTLKGSGRMAGLDAIADAAWIMESLLNRWLEAELPASAALCDLIGSAHECFRIWINELARDGRTSVDAAVLAAKAEMVLASDRQMQGDSASSSAQSIDDPVETSRTVVPTEASMAGHGRPVGVGAAALPDPLFGIFIDEARQHVATLRDGVQRLRTGDCKPDAEACGRAAHTLAGIARSAGFGNVSDVASLLEDILRASDDRIGVLAVAEPSLEVLDEMIECVAKRETPTLDPIRGAQLRNAARQLLNATDANTAVVSSSGAIASGSATGNERRTWKDDIDVQLLPIFLDEVRDLAFLIGEDLRHLRDEPKDLVAAQSLLRVLHTIKGSARMVGAMRLGELVHIMEGRVEQAVAKAAFTFEVLDLLEGELDRLNSGFDTLARGAPGNRSAALALVESSTPASQTGADAATPASAEDNVPAFAAQVRVASDTLDNLVNQAGEISIARARIEAESGTLRQFVLELTDSVARLRGQLREIEIQAESRMQATLGHTPGHEPLFDPLEFDRFTRFQELTRLTAESLHDLTTVQQNLLTNLDEMRAALSSQSRLNRVLQDDLMRLRTVPFQSVGERLYRIVRQACRETGKRATFELNGGQTEVDRGLLERIVAPLEHLVRNSVAHGIEGAEVRVAAGKPETGVVRLTLRQETNDLLVVVSDDGAGLNHDRIRAKAIELGWISRDGSPDRSELERMIFRPGFSTTDEVTELAGRGIGMDVVANEVRGLGGSIDITTENGKGTAFQIRVPLTVAVAKALLVSSGGRIAAILSSIVEQVQEVTREELAALLKGREVEWKENHYPLFYLADLLGETASSAADRPKHYVLLLRSGDRRVAILVDRLTVNQDVVLKKIGPQLARLPGISGATVLPDGQVSLILNPLVLTENKPNAVAVVKQMETGSQQTPPMPLIMVVDDSLTVRKITSRLLTRQGYRVITAKDGLDALQQAQETLPDVMLVDIEMPRMDGFDLTKNLKASSRSASVPIIMITSRLAPKHRDYANQLGVDVYLGKPFEEQDLLDHIARFAARAAAA